MMPKIQGQDVQMRMRIGSPAMPTAPPRAIPPGIVDHAGQPVMGPKRPASSRSYDRLDLTGATTDGWPNEAWKRGRIKVLSGLILAEYRGAPAWQWLVSISLSSKNDPKGARADDETCRRVLVDFDIVGAEEDNHEPGVARKFFRNVDLKPGEVSLCECKEDEERVVEPDGYTWSRSKDD